MSMRIPPPIQPLPPTHATPVTPAEHGAQLHLRLNGLAAGLANTRASGEATQTGLATFNANAKITTLERKQALQRSLHQRATRGQRGSAPRLDDADPALEAAAAKLASAFTDGDEEALEEQLGQRPDPLQRHTLLKHTRALLQKQAAAMTGPRQGTLTVRKLIQKLDAMLNELLENFAEEINAGLESVDGLANALGEMEQPDLGPESGVDAAEGKVVDPSAPQMEGGPAGDTPLAQLRANFGAGSDGKLDQRIVPSDMYAALRRMPGAGDLKKALAAGRARMTGKLKSRGKGGPQLWLSLDDAKCFTTVLTCDALAGDLRRDLSDKEQANLTPQAEAEDITMLLLRAGEPERDKAAMLMNTLVGPESATAPQQRAKACKLLRSVLADLPATLNQGDAKPRLQALCADLDAMRVKLHASLATPRSETDTFEQGLRASRRATQGAN